MKRILLCLAAAASLAAFAEGNRQVEVTYLDGVDRYEVSLIRKMQLYYDEESPCVRLFFIDGSLAEMCGARVVAFNATASGLAAAQERARLAVYPNPAAETLVVDGCEPDAAVTVFTIGGSVLATRRLDGGALHVGGLPQGVYLIKVADTVVKFTKK